MKKILFFNPAIQDEKMFNPDVRDGYNDPYIYLRQRLLSLGYQLTSFQGENISDFAWICFNDSISTSYYLGFKGLIRKGKLLLLGKQPRDIFNECLKEGLNKRMGLFLWEPPTVMPDNWKKALSNKFEVVFTWNDRLIDHKKFFKIHWPQTNKFPTVANVPFEEKKLLVNITGNKDSRHPRELYTARRKSIRYFEKHFPNDFDLYGVGWNRPANRWQKLFPFLVPHYASYRGTVANKWDVYPKYKFGLCYENIQGEPGYVTEKIFDCMRADCVPIYWGADNVTDYVDSGAFIDRRKFKSDQELASFLTTVTKDEYASYQKAITAYLHGDKFKQFLPEAYTETIIKGLKL